MRSAPLRVAAYTGSRTVSGSRFRVRQYIKRLGELGVEVREFPSRFESYPPRAKLLRPLWGVATVAQRIRPVALSYRYDVTLLYREMVSTFLTLEPFTKAPRVLDVDDAIWLHRRGAFFPRLVRHCSGALCGNAYIAEFVSHWIRGVRVVPTAVDTDRFRPRIDQRPSGPLVIGWSGLPSGFPYLQAIERPIATVLERNPSAVLRIVSRWRPLLTAIPEKRVEFVEWSEENEVETIQGMTVGLMPLDQSPWCLGKCSYKMLLYMSCGVPTVVSPVGMNAEVLARGPVGFGPGSDDEWVEAIEALLRDPRSAQEMGRAGRDVVLSHYSLDVVAPAIASYLETFA